MKFSLIKKTTLTLSVLLTGFSVYPQQQDTLLTQTLPEVVVTATRTEKPLLNTGRSISVIDQDDIRNSFSGHLPEQLGSLSGLYVMGTGQNYGSVNTAFVRGANSDHLAIYIDGFPLVDPSSVSNSLDLNELSAGTISRVELLRGSHSTLYGSSAIGGVLNLVGMKNDPGEFVASVKSVTGTFGQNTFLLNNRFEAGAGFNNGFYVNASLQQENVNGIDLTTDTVTNPNTYNNPDRDGFTKLDYALRGGYRDKKADAFIEYRSNSHQSDLDKRAFTDDDNRYLEFNRNILLYGARYKLTEKMLIRLSGGYSGMWRQDTDDSSIVDAGGQYDHQYARSTFTGNYQYHEAGINFRQNSIETTAALFYRKENMNNRNYIYSYSPWFGIYEQNYDLDSLHISETTMGAYAQVDLNGQMINKNLSPLNLVAGGRFLHHDRFGNHFTWELNPSWKFGANSLLYFSASTGFNSPSLYRLYAPDRSFGAVVSRGNTTLLPETSVALELGYKQKIKEGTTIQLAVFQNNVNNLIEYVYLWDKNIGLDTLGNDWLRNDYKGDTYLNLSRHHIRGVEISIDSRIGSKFYVNGNFTFLKASTGFNPDDIDTSVTHGHHVQLFESGVFLTQKVEEANLTRRPNVVVNLSLRYKPAENWEISVTENYIGGRYDVYYNASLGPYGALDRNFVDAYTLTGISVNYQPVSHLNVGLKVGNLFNTQYYEIMGFNTQGRSFFVRMNYTFQGKG